MDVYMKCLPCPDCEIQGDSPSVHRLIMQVLNLLVALIMDKIEMETYDKIQQSNHRDVRFRDNMDGSCRALKAIDTVLNAIPVTANAVLDHLGEVICFENHVSRSYSMVDHPLIIIHSPGRARCGGEIIRIRPVTTQHCGE